jgi:hypothetical protein
MVIEPSIEFSANFRQEHPLPHQRDMSQQQNAQSSNREGRIQLALAAYNNHQFQSLRRAAKAFDVPFSTLTSRYNGITANKKDYSLPKAYRVISLLNCLGKAFEKILATRLSYLAETGDLLQETQIGGRKQKSALDACLLLQSKVQEAWEKKHTTALLFVDVRGAFDHVSANQLLAMCKKLKLPLVLIRWISSFLSQRSVQLKFNGQTQPLQRVKIGIPQGSPISPILFLLYIRDICKTRPDTFTFSYIDDICIGASARSTKKLKTILERTAKAILQEAGESAIEFDVEKTELLYASRKREITAEPVQVGESLIQPSSCVRWLGFFLDNKLSYKKHVQTKAAAAQKVFQRIKRLGNTQRGLTTQATRQLYTACVTLIADYGIQLWWNAHIDNTELSDLSLPVQLQEDLDHAASLLTRSIQEAAKKAIPKARPCERSKPWWNKDLAEQRKPASKALRPQQDFPTPTNTRRAKSKRDQYLHAVKKTKASHWDSFLQNAKGKDIFKALSYTEQRTTRVIPELQYMQGGERRTAKEFKDQCTAFTTTLFSSPPNTNTRLQ